MKAYTLGFVGREDTLCRVKAAEGAYASVKDRNPLIVKSRGHSKQTEEKESYWTPSPYSLSHEGYFHGCGLMNYRWSRNYSGVAVSHPGGFWYQYSKSKCTFSRQSRIIQFGILSNTMLLHPIAALY